MSRIDRPDQLAQGEEGFLQYFADRKRVYPKRVYGRVRSVKWAVLVICLTVYYALPWLRWDRGEGRPDQAILLDIADRHFFFFNMEFWPQDIYYLTGLLILAAVGLFLVTSLFGRLWCGFACPQTVWTDLFMFVERQIEGDRNERMRRDAAPMSFDTAWRKALKHGLWLAIAFWTGGAWIMYYIDAPTAVHEFWTGSADPAVYAFVGLFTATTYLLAGWAREQVCTFMCPWPRFQAAMVDEQSLIVTYQAWRGEKRGHLKAQRNAAPGETYGDCIDCAGCVTACPTGIDIRDGSQLECIGCGLCIDACDMALAKVGRPTGLIAWDNLERQAAKARGETLGFHLFRPRTLIYASAMSLAFTVMVIAMSNRSDLSLSVQPDRAPLFVRLPDGTIRDGYTLKIANRNQTDAVFELHLEGLPGGELALAEAHADRATMLRLPVGPDQVASFRVLATAPSHGASTSVNFVLHDTKGGDTTTEASVFLGPAQ